MANADALWSAPGAALPPARSIVELAERVLSDSVVKRRVVEFGRTAPGNDSTSRVELTITDVLTASRSATDRTDRTRQTGSRLEMRDVGGDRRDGRVRMLALAHLSASTLLFVFALMLIAIAGPVRSRPSPSPTDHPRPGDAWRDPYASGSRRGHDRVVDPVAETEIAPVTRSAQSDIAASWAVAFRSGCFMDPARRALSEIGLPRWRRTLALLSFNVGVELGQLAFVAAILALQAFLTRLPLPTRVRRAACRVLRDRKLPRILFFDGLRFLA
jgi:hypothetical protein